MNIKNGGYQRQQDGCVEIHKTKDFCTIKSNKINIRRKATEKGNILEYNQKNLLFKIYEDLTQYIRSIPRFHKIRDKKKEKKMLTQGNLDGKPSQGKMYSHYQRYADENNFKV